MTETDFQKLIGELKEKSDNFKKIKIAVLSSYTPQNIKDSLTYFLLKNGFYPEIKFGGYNQYNQELMQKDSWIYEFKPDIVILAISSESVFPTLYYDIAKNDYEKVRDESLEKINFLIRSLNSFDLSSKIIITSLEHVDSPFGIMDYSKNDGVKSIIDECNKQIIDLSRKKSNLLILDSDKFIKKIGKENLRDNKLYYLGKLALSNKAAVKFSQELINFINPVYGHTKKCLVLDLDNTLWGGVIGEDGVENLKIGDSAVGSIYSDIQKIALGFKEMGTLLCIVSKNNLEDVMPVFERKEMILKEKDFVSMKINWKTKSENIQELAKELNLGLDSFVFLDDNPAERLEVKSRLPMVEVIDFPQDLADLPSMLKELPHFQKITLTEEDKKRHELYLQEKKRNELKDTLDLKDYLKELNIKMQVSRNDNPSLERISQLINKTNQFNLRTQRYSEEEVQKMMSSADHDIFSVRVWDKFSELGLTGIILVKKLDEKSCFIDSFLMSCRILSRGIEDQFFTEVFNTLKDEYEVIKAEFLRTKKNSQVEDFYEKLGFKLIDSEEDKKTYELLINEINYDNCDWIEVINE